MPVSLRNAAQLYGKVQIRDVDISVIVCLFRRKQTLWETAHVPDNYFPTRTEPEAPEFMALSGADLWSESSCFVHFLNGLSTKVCTFLLLRKKARHLLLQENLVTCAAANFDCLRDQRGQWRSKHWKPALRRRTGRTSCGKRASWANSTTRTWSRWWAWWPKRSRWWSSQNSWKMAPWIVIYGWVCAFCATKREGRRSRRLEAAFDRVKRGRQSRGLCFACMLGCPHVTLHLALIVTVLFLTLRWLPLLILLCFGS